MSEIQYWRKSDCDRALEMLAEFVDGELAVEDSKQLGMHLERCAGCSAALAGMRQMDGELAAWGQYLDRRNPAHPSARARLAQGMRELRPRRRVFGWIPVAASVVAAALTLVTVAPHFRATAPVHAAPRFVGIPYLPPLDPHENVTVVRMDVRVGVLLSAGYKIAADPDTLVPADVLVGEDGRAHAVRVLSGIELN